MPPEEIPAGRMGIPVFVRELMVHSVSGNPPGWSSLCAADAEYCERTLQQLGTGKTAMGQQPMIAKIDADHPEEINACDKKCDASPTEEPRDEYQQRKQVNHDEPDYSSPIDFSGAGCIVFALNRSFRPHYVSLSIFNIELEYRTTTQAAALSHHFSGQPSTS
jgi:hypothetical protein